MLITQPTSLSNTVITKQILPTDVSQAIFTADRPYQVTAVTAVWGVAGGLGATANVEKLTGTTAPGSGTSLLTSNFDLTTAVNTVNTGTLTGTTANLQLATEDRLGVKLGGVLTGLTGSEITITLKPI